MDDTYRMIVGLALIAAATGCAEPVPEPPPRAPNVLIITIDALRADSVSWAGAEFDTTPNLASLATDSAVFDQAVTSFPGTTASMPSLMTGLFPNFEDVTEWNRFTYHGFNGFETAEEASKPIISDNLTMLAERFRDHGYRTIGFNTNPNLTKHRNFDQGFIDYEDFGAYMKAAREQRQHPLEGAYPPVDVVMAKAIPALRAAASEPFFMWMHLMEPHSPYLPPSPHDRLPPREFTELSDLEINGALYHFLYRQRGARQRQIEHPSLDDLGISQAELTEHLLGLYEGEIHFCDSQLGRLFSEMDTLGLLDQTLVIVTADHGEEFFDHGYVTHHFQSALAEELIRIPLLVRPPTGIPGGRRVSELVRMVDLTPTVLDFVGVGAPVAGMDGVSLRPLLEGGELDELTAYFSTIEYGIVRTERWKYRLEKTASGNGGPVERLYDIVTDPMENDDIAADHPGTVRDLREAWTEFTNRLTSRAAATGPESSSGPKGDDVDPATREQLEALGYLE